MITLLGSLLGFGTSFLPKLLDFGKRVKDQKHELELMKEQREIMKLQGAAALETAKLAATSKTNEWTRRQDVAALTKASRWVVNLSASVRPVITYVFFVEFIILTVMLYFGGLTIEKYNVIWSQEMQGLWAAVISYWFGSRTFNRESHS